MMSPSRAFLFFVDDWLSSSKIALMTAEEERGYLRLLLHAWKQPDCGLPDDDPVLARLSLIPRKSWQNGSGAKLRNCFVARGGRLYNERLLREWRNQQHYRQERSSAGRKGAATRWKATAEEGVPDSSANGLATGSANDLPMAEPMLDVWQNDANSSSSYKDNSTKLTTHTKSATSSGISQPMVHDEPFKEFIGVALAAGKQLSDRMLERAFAKWSKYGTTERTSIVADYRSKCTNGTWSDERHTPFPHNYLDSEAWRAVGGSRILLPRPVANKREETHARAAARFIQEQKEIADETT